MKTLILWILVLTIASVSNAQNVDIPDTAFLNALIEAGVDTDKDGEISFVEAEAVTSLDLEGEFICGDEDSCWFIRQPIESLEGIQAFINLDSLNCCINHLTSLDVSNNTGLKWLWCDGNQLTSLDVSGCTALTWLDCGCFHYGCYFGNQLTSIDLSNNIALTYLSCGGNLLASLDVSNNTALTFLDCATNQLTDLDFSNNIALEYLRCGRNQLTSLNVSGCTALKSLSCGNNQLTSLDVSCNTALESISLHYMETLLDVYVWESFFGHVQVETYNSPNVIFITDECSITTLNTYNKNRKINIYPNPSDDIINIEIENKNNAKIEIHNVSGKLVFSKAVISKIEKIDISGFPKGIYIVKIMHDTGINTGKVVVR